MILSNNRLKTVPPEIGQLKALKVLHLTNCELYDDSLPAEFSGLDALEELNLSLNGLTNFDIVAQLTNLKRLNISGNDILSLPSAVSFE